MRLTLRTLSTWAALAWLCAALPALAQPAPAKPAAKAAAKAPAKPARKPRAPAPVPPPPPPPLEDATPEQVAAAELTLYGVYECDFKQTVEVSVSPRSAGYVDVKLAKQTWTMKPVLSSTGALRLEDVLGGTLMLQIANKSMLMDVKAGRRLVDDCVHEKQREAMARAAEAAAAATPASAAEAAQSRIFVPQ